MLQYLSERIACFEYLHSPRTALKWIPEWIFERLLSSYRHEKIFSHLSQQAKFLKRIVTHVHKNYAKFFYLVPGLVVSISMLTILVLLAPGLHDFLLRSNRRHPILKKWYLSAYILCVSIKTIKIGWNIGRHFCSRSVNSVSSSCLQRYWQ